MYARIALSILLALAPATAFAATLGVAPAHRDVRAGDTISFEIMLRADESINTVGTAVRVPDGLSFVSAKEGPFPMQWVQKPYFDASQKEVMLSGIMPGGWSGVGTLATLVFKAKQGGEYTLTFDESQTELYKNDGNATPEPITIGSITTFNIDPFVLGGLFVMLVLTVLWFMRHTVKITFA